MGEEFCHSGFVGDFGYALGVKIENGQQEQTYKTGCEEDGGDPVHSVEKVEVLDDFGHLVDDGFEGF